MKCQNWADVTRLRCLYRIGWFSILFGALLSLVACVAPPGFHHFGVTTPTMLPLQVGETIGQTLTSYQDGLTGVEVYLQPAMTGEGVILLRLRTQPTSTIDLATASLPVTTVTQPGFYSFRFTNQSQSRQRDYYAVLEVVGGGSVLVGSAHGDTYLDGALYADGEPQDAQLVFRLVFDPIAVWLGMISRLAAGMVALLAGILLFILPGWAVVLIVWPEPRALAWVEQIGLAAGISLAFHPIVLIWTNLVGLQLGGLYVWLPALLALGILAWRCRTWRSSAIAQSWRHWVRSATCWPDLALIVVLVFVFGVRLLVIDPVAAPLWGDSYHHTMIAQLLVDNNGLFDSWQPYSPYTTLTVQFGYPAAVALYAWLTGTSSIEAALLSGQILNGLAIVSLYPLALRLTNGSRWAGVGAVLVAGLLSPMPAFYVNWGRYAQLAGQLVLPVAIWLLWDMLESNTFTWRKAVLAGAVVTGMTLNYYRMPFYYVTFVVVFLLVWALPRWGLRWSLWWRGLAHLTLAGVIAVALFMPWAVRVAGSSLADKVSGGVGARSPVALILADYAIWRIIETYVPLYLIVLTLLGLVWSLASKRWLIASLGLWTLVLASLVAGQLIQLPGANMMQSFAIIISLYIPVSLVIGYLFGQAAVALGAYWPGAGSLAACLAVIAIAGWGAWQQRGIIDPVYTLVTRPDLKAMDWISTETAPDARFLVQGFRIYGGTSAVGADAGWWIPLLTGRDNTMPPQYAMLNEAAALPGYTRQVVNLVAQLETIAPTESAGLRALCDWGVTHVYIGQVQGRVGAGVRQLFQADDLLQSPAFQLRYRQDRVSIFAFDHQECEALP
ncbi:MAG: hypothetical protein MI924_09625 [Chloroflexales bacterium]|nr:hypothetical protein [Chloroflexales bacterium]